MPIALFAAVHGVSWAALSLKTWNSGDTLTATDLNANFDSVKNEVLARTPFVDVDTRTGTFQSISSTSYVDFNAGYPDWTVTVPVDGEYLLWFTSAVFTPV